MNIRTIYEIAVVLTRSQIRGTQRSKTIARIFGDPRIILIVDVSLLALLGFAGYFLTSIGPPFLRRVISSSESGALAAVPVAIAFAIILFGVLYEISQPIQSLNTDMVNWLPISATEYVAGSALSECYLYSFMLSLFLGALLGPAVILGMGHVWFAAAVMSTIALAIGACVVEILDAITNRISSSFYRKSGRSAIFFRLVVTVIIIVFIQLIFSGQVTSYLLRSLVQAVEVGWFVPVIWPSAAVLGLSEGNLYDTVIFATLSGLFALALFWVAVKFRAKFWVPVPVAVQLSTKPYHAQRFQLPGIGIVEAAILRKDLRSLTRRREMARFLAIPFVLGISLGLSLFSFRGAGPADELGLTGAISFFILPVTIFVGILSMTSIGQEGYAVWNLYVAPLGVNQLLAAKLLFPVLMGAGFSVGMLVIFSILAKSLASYFGLMLALGLAIVFEESAIGICFGARFPDFREMVRSRYVGVWGSLLGTATAIVSGAITALPIILSLYSHHSVLPQYLALSFIIAGGIFAFASVLAKSLIKNLLRNVRV